MISFYMGDTVLGEIGKEVSTAGVYLIGFVQELSTHCLDNFKAVWSYEQCCKWLAPLLTIYCFDFQPLHMITKLLLKLFTQCTNNSYSLLGLWNWWYLSPSNNLGRSNIKTSFSTWLVSFCVSILTFIKE